MSAINKLGYPSIHYQETRKREDRLQLTRHYVRRVVLHLRSDPAIISILLVIVGVVHGLQMTVTPSLVTTDDEGTYVAQAWAILHEGSLAPYTYWYDHPPLGWIQIAGWAWLTDAFNRYTSAIAVGREFMLVVDLASVPLLYTLAKRLGMNRTFAAGAVALFALSPLAVYFQRLTFLDNITIPWVLGSFVLAASPKNRLSAHTASAACFAVAILTKETILLVLPALLYQLYLGTHPRTRRMAFTIWVTVFGAASLFYPLMAVIKNELLPGPGHVDMWYAINWQLFSRAPSGSMFNPSSAASVITQSWWQLDPWVIGLGTALILPACFSQALRPVALALAIQVGVMLRPGGYLPQPYVIALMPFAALVIVGAVSALWNTGQLHRYRPLRGQIPRTGYSYAHVLVKVPALALIAVFALGIAMPEWTPQLKALTSDNRNASVTDAMEWIKTHVSTRKGDGATVRLIVSDAMWVDLKRLGYDPDWYFKVDLDPAVKITYPHGWQDVDYVIFTNEMNEIAKSASKSDMTTTIAARQHGQLVAKYGTLSEQIWIYRVEPTSLG